MSHNKKREKRKVGIEAIVEQGVGAIYVRGTWMKKLDDLGRRKRARFAFWNNVEIRQVKLVEDVLKGIEKA
ncbi:MAG: hypothetical protein AOA65_0385 [Candidatus Bathyarchaeota archaeon BA1]|nr:MAG: hypothetical protein AOA65_0385 [Candidatus Bathyarchaeota archaeon BA1]